LEAAVSEDFVISGWFDYGEHRDQVLAAFSECARLSREEPGCLDYWVAADPERSGRLYVFERWTCEADLVEHFTTPHVAEFRAAVSVYPRTDRSVKRYFVTHTEEFQASQVS